LRRLAGRKGKSMSKMIELHAIEKGRGTPLVFVPGWSQSAVEFHHQIEGLSDRYRVIAVDMRGHGDSPKPPSGYRIARLAADLDEFLEAQGLDNVVLAGHSMGASVIWSYLEQFGGKRVARLIFIDQAALVTNGIGLSGQALLDAGCAFTPETLYATATAVAADQAAVVDGFRAAFFSAHIDDTTVAFTKAETLKMPAEYAARLLIDHASQDWRDVIRHVVAPLKLPTLVVGGALATLFPPEAQAWIAAQIPGSTLAILSAEERGSHFMFLENPTRFNALVRDFLG
jgi:non-heme chloroperoxidase